MDVFGKPWASFCHRNDVVLLLVFSAWGSQKYMSYRTKKKKKKRIVQPKMSSVSIEKHESSPYPA